jgi:hypothetical protein
MYVSRLLFHTVPGKTREVEQELKKLRDMVSAPAVLTREYCVRILLRWAQPTRPSSRRRLTGRLSKNRSKS